MRSQLFLQLINMTAAAIGIFGWVLWARHYRDINLYAVSPITWLAHLLLFYTSVLVRDATGFQFPWSYELWSAVLRMQAIFTLAGISYMMLHPYIIRFLREKQVPT